jgi:hypothetical protein
MEFRKALVAQPWARGGISLLVDHSLLDPRLFTAGDARDLGATLGAPADRMGEGTVEALVARSPAVFGILTPDARPPRDRGGCRTRGRPGREPRRDRGVRHTRGGSRLPARAGSPRGACGRTARGGRLKGPSMRGRCQIGRRRVLPPMHRDRTRCADGAG